MAFHVCERVGFRSCITRRVWLYCGIDLQARTMDLCLINQGGERASSPSRA